MSGCEFLLCVESKKDLAGHRKNTNNEFAGFPLYRGNSVSSPRDGNSNMERREGDVLGVG